MVLPVRWRCELAGVVGAATLLALTLGACRRIDVCEDGYCGTMRSAGGQAPIELSDAGGGGEAETEAGGGEGGGDSNAAGGAATVDQGEPPTLLCQTGKADCDKSSLTGCETDLGWSLQHCGACGARCEDGCRGGECLKSQLLLVDATIVSFATKGDLAFALVQDFGSTTTLERFDLDSGSRDVLLLDVWEGELALSDRVYVLRATDTLLSMALDGTDLADEGVTPSSIGGYPGGAYFVESFQDSEGNSRATLHYRARGKEAWHPIVSRGPGRIESSSVYGVVYREVLDSGDEQLSLLRGAELAFSAELPPWATAIEAVEDGIAVLTDGAGGDELWWLSGTKSAVHYALGSALRDELSMQPYHSGVVLSVREGPAAALRLYDDTGPLPGHIGVPIGSVLVDMGDHYLWHAIFDDWLHARVSRTTWQSFGF